MTTVADVDLSTWNRYTSSPRLRGSDPFGSNLISVGQAVESDLAQSIAGGDVVAAYTPSADSRLIYVSTSGNDGTATETTIAAQTDAFDPQGTVLPYLTLSAAKARMRDGYPDWILLKRGDTWTGELLGTSLSGRSASERMMFTYYGTTGARPILQTGTSTAFTANNSNDYYGLYGLDLYAHTRDPNHASYVAGSAGGNGLSLVGGGDDIVIDDCIIRFYKVNITVQSFGGNLFSNLTIKRNIILDSYSYVGEGHSQGMYIEGINGILMEDNLLDHNGWNETDILAEPTVYNHNVYMQYNSYGTITVRNNIFTRASSHGLQARSGGAVYGNLAAQNSINLLLGSNLNTGYTPLIAQAYDNVVLDGKLMDPNGIYSTVSTAVYGMDVDSSATINANEVSLTNNIVANVRDTAGASLVGIRSTANVTYSANVVYDWSGNTTVDGTWPHPADGIAEYMTSIGETATFVAFLDIQRNRGLGVWETKHTALQANNYFRAGFNK